MLLVQFISANKSMNHSHGAVKSAIESWQFKLMQHFRPIDEIHLADLRMALYNGTVVDSDARNISKLSSKRMHLSFVMNARQRRISCTLISILDVFVRRSNQINVNYGIYLELCHYELLIDGDGCRHRRPSSIGREKNEF